MEWLTSFPWAEHVELFKENFDLRKWELFHFVGPVFAYWALCIVYDVLDSSKAPFVLKYRLDENKRKNTITKSHVIWRVLLQHAIQVALGSTVLFLDPHMCKKPEKGWAGTALDFVLAMFVFDTWQYWIHRSMHESKFLYNLIHSVHHQLYTPYAYGALYNHPLEAFFLDSVGAVVTAQLLGVTCKTAGYFFTAASLKTVFDHCSYRFPLNPVYHVFANNSRYHNVHHDLRGFRKNYSQPFFTIWDRLMGTYLHPRDLYEVEPAKARGSAKGKSSDAADSLVEATPALAATDKKGQ